VVADKNISDLPPEKDAALREGLLNAISDEFGSTPTNETVERLVRTVYDHSNDLNPAKETALGSLQGNILPIPSIGRPTSAKYYLIHEEDITYLRMCDGSNLSAIWQICLGAAIGSLLPAMQSISSFYTQSALGSKQPLTDFEQLKLAELSGSTMLLNGITLIVFISVLVIGTKDFFHHRKTKNNLTSRLNTIVGREEYKP